MSTATKEAIELRATSVTHAHIKRILHPTLGVEVDGRSCVKHLRFRRRVRIAHLELPRGGSGRWEPAVPQHPAHVTVSVLDDLRWRVVKEVEFPRVPLIAGDGLPHDSLPAEMAEQFQYVFSERIRIDLDGLETDHLRVECDREHPVWPVLSELSRQPSSRLATPEISRYATPIIP